MFYFVLITLHTSSYWLILQVSYNYPKFAHEELETPLFKDLLKVVSPDLGLEARFI